MVRIRSDRTHDATVPQLLSLSLIYWSPCGVYPSIGRRERPERGRQTQNPPASSAFLQRFHSVRQLTAGPDLVGTGPYVSPLIQTTASIKSFKVEHVESAAPFQNDGTADFRSSA